MLGGMVNTRFLLSATPHIFHTASANIALNVKMAMMSLGTEFFPNIVPPEPRRGPSQPLLKRRRSETTSAFGRVTMSTDNNSDVVVEEPNRPRKTRRLQERVSSLSSRSITSATTVAAIIPTFGAIDLSVPDALGLDETTPAAFSQALEEVLTDSPIERSLVGTHHSSTNGNENNSISNNKTNDWWFLDGDIVIGVGSLLFKVHKKILASHSSVFADMFALSKASDRLEDVDTVQLHDSAEEWLETLDWIYNKRPSYNTGDDAESISFTTVQRHLAISNKYDMAELQEQALSQFEKLYPSRCIIFLIRTTPSQKLAAYQSAVDALLLARRCNVRSVLPTIFYCLATSRHGEDGHSSYHLDIDPCDIQRLSIGKDILKQVSEALTRDFILPREMIPQDVLEAYPDAADDDIYLRSFCQPSGQSRCKASLMEAWWTTSSKPFPIARGDYLLPERLRDMIESSSSLDLCPVCTSALVSRVAIYLQLLLESIPRWFELL